MLPEEHHSSRRVWPVSSSYLRIVRAVTTGSMRRSFLFPRCFALFLVLLCGSSFAKAQQSAAALSQPQQSSEDSASDAVQPKNDRIFKVLPNYRTVENPNIRMAPLSTKGKFHLALEDSFDPYAYVIAGALPDWGR